jgi:hypothetical protein
MRETADVLGRLAALETELARLRTLVIDAPPVTSDAALLPHEQAGTEPSASRRDLLRYGAAAIGAAAAAGMAASPVEAADGGPLIIGVDNIGTNGTTLTATLGTGLDARATNISGGVGLVGRGTGAGIHGETSSTSTSGTGVSAWSTSATGQAPGVSGVAFSPNAPSVYGRNWAGGNAMRAEVPSFSVANAIALYALNYSSYTGGGPGAGGFAIYGLSANGHGLVGATAAAGAAAVVGASNGVAGAYAGVFYGPVVVGGTFTVFGAKSAAVPHPDGSHRRLYCMESPESWFEDFGRGTLVCGEATVALDPDFAAVVDASDYHVFVTAYDSDSYLNVLDRSPGGFRVRANQAAEGAFSWRVVAKRKDITGARLERVEIPEEPTLPDVPASVYEPMPSPPDIPRRSMAPRRPNGKP